MANIIAILVIALIVGAALLYIRKEKKKGIRCIGCPSAGSCSKSHGCGAPPKMPENHKQ